MRDSIFCCPAGIKPDLITFSTLIKGYCAHGQMDKGLLLLKAMKQKNINPDGVLYNSLLDGCVRAGVSAAADACRSSLGVAGAQQRTARAHLFHRRISVSPVSTVLGFSGPHCASNYGKRCKPSGSSPPTSP